MQKEGRSGIFPFFETERKRFIAYVRRKMLDISSMDAEDMVEEVMLALLNRPDPASRIENLAAYVYRALSHKVADLARLRRRTASLDAREGEDGASSLMALLRDTGPSAAETMEKKEFYLRLAKALDGLEPRQRAVFLATEIGGHSFRELSERWNEPMGTLLSRKCRAVKNLREMLKDLAP